MSPEGSSILSPPFGQNLDPERLQRALFEAHERRPPAQETETRDSTPLRYPSPLRNDHEYWSQAIRKIYQRAKVLGLDTAAQCRKHVLNDEYWQIESSYLQSQYEKHTASEGIEGSELGIEELFWEGLRDVRWRDVYNTFAGRAALRELGSAAPSLETFRMKTSNVIYHMSAARYWSQALCAAGLEAEKCREGIQSSTYWQIELDETNDLVHKMEKKRSSMPSQIGKDAKKQKRLRNRQSRRTKCDENELPKPIRSSLPAQVKSSQLQARKVSHLISSPTVSPASLRRSSRIRQKTVPKVEGGKVIMHT